jgi:phosphoribosylcarboxyaminoimidazole (NCAIR) mutase
MALGKSGAKNAAVFALEILGLTDKKIQNKLNKFKKGLVASIRQQRIKI